MSEGREDLGQTVAELAATGASDAPPAEPASGAHGLVFATLPPEARYELGAELGHGQQGVVYRAHDRILRRDVALKALRARTLTEDRAAVERFVAEAQLTAQLMHPHVVPIYDAGTLPDGRPYYTMPLLARRDLQQVLTGLRAGDADLAREYGLVKMMRLFAAACMGVQAAHDAGVVHRDLKPGNLILGPTGELRVADFGLAQLVGSTIHTDRLDVTSLRTHQGSPVGTPYYMSPEQARGDLGAITARSDIWALGAILYEVLTLRPPLEGPSVAAQLVAILSEDPIDPVERAPTRDVPVDLAALAMRCLQKDPARRPASARTLVEELDAWFAGTRERERREQEAGRAVAQARSELSRAEHALARAMETHHRARRALRALADHAPASAKEPAWALADAARSARHEVERHEDEAIASLESALRSVPDHDEARELLVGVHLSRHGRAEVEGDEGAAARHAQSAFRVGGAEIVAGLNAPAELAVDLPTPLELALDKYEARGRRLHPLPTRRFWAHGAGLSLPPGSYRLVAFPDSPRPVYLPIRLRRGQRVRLPFDPGLAARLPAGLVLVHRGPAVLGGDEDVARELVVPTFAIAERPTTCGEYLEFLRALPVEEALRRAPRPSASAPPYWPVGVTGHLELPERDEQGDRWEPGYPLLGVSALDAEAYARWRSARDGLSYRLPTELEWERAARGADGRRHPWGDHLDPAFCHMRRSRPGRMGPEPVDAFPIDVSPFGVRGMGGCIADWTASAFRDDPRTRCVKGGGWSTRAHRCAASFRGSMDESDPSGDLGFRLAMDVPASA